MSEYSGKVRVYRGKADFGVRVDGEGRLKLLDTIERRKGEAVIRPLDWKESLSYAASKGLKQEQRRSEWMRYR